MATGHPPFTGGKPLDEFVKNAMVTVRGCQKLAQELQGWQHYRDYPGVHRTMDQVNSTIVSLVGAIFKHQDIKLDLSRHRLSDQLEMIREGNDALLERINSDIDEAAGVRKNQDAQQLPSVIKKVEAPVSSGKSVVLLAARNVQKPQLFFEEKIDNSSKEPFIPIIKEKPNSMKPLSIIICLDSTGQEFYSHPYEYELHHWNPAPYQLEAVMPVPPRDLDDTPLVMVDTPHYLSVMVKELAACSEIAVDLEHHAYRSYLGLTCLMQISTRTTDYIVDTITLRGKLTILNEVFTNPKITKVIHGSDYDVLWLQRDCGVYLVNLFDTHQAAVVLEYPHRSLAALLFRFCNIQANKVFQRADWRIRPLPQEFIDYARQDTHYLLFIFDLLRNELVEKGNQLNNLITSVFDRSRELCLKRFDKPVVGPESHMGLYRHARKTFNSRQIFALRGLYLWRDKIGRDQDESPEFVLPKHMMLQIAEVLPKEMQGILACCNPIPPLVKTDLLTLHTIIREAREQQLLEVKRVDVVQEYQNNAEELTSYLNQNLTCKHDLSECDDNPTDLPCLLNPKTTLLQDSTHSSKILLTVMKFSLLFGISQKKVKSTSCPRLNIDQLFMGPYERYTAYNEMKPLLEGYKEKKEKDVKASDLDRVNRVKELFLTLTQNTPAEFNESMAVATNHVPTEDTQVTADGSVLQFNNEGPSDQQQEIYDNTGNEMQPTKRKNIRDPPKTMIIDTEIKMEKANKSKKRKSGEKAEEGNSPSKVLKIDEDKTDEEEKDNNVENADSVSDGPKDNTDNEGFNYNEANFTMFLKAQRKLHDSRQKVSDNFKGKNQKSKRGKSSMKSFSWGGNAGNKDNW